MNEKIEIERQEQTVKEIANELFSFNPKDQATILKQVKSVLLERCEIRIAILEEELLGVKADQKYFNS